MKSKNIMKYLIIFGYILWNISLIETQSLDQPRKRVEANQDIQITHKSWNQTTYYYITIDQKHENEELIVLLKLQSRMDNFPIIYISKTQKYPGPDKNISEMVQCYVTKDDFCLFPKEQISLNDEISIGVYCYVNCSYELHVRYTKNIQLKLGSETILWFSKNETKVITVQIPNDISINNINIEAHPIRINQITERFHMEVEQIKENQQQLQRKFMEMSDSWNNGLVAISEEGQDEFCRNCSYKVILESGTRSMIKLRTWSRQNNTQIRPEYRKYESISSGRQITYVLNLSNSVFDQEYLRNNIINIEIVPYSGILDLYVNPEIQPTNLSYYRWKLIDSQKTELVLTPEERQKSGATDTIYYITLDIIYSSTYSMLVYMKNKNNILLEFGTIEQGIILNQEIINYKLVVASKNLLNISAMLTSNTGNADMFIKMCKTHNDEDCQVTIKDIQGLIFKNQTVDSSVFYYSNYSDKIDIIQFQHQTNNCKDDSFMSRFFTKRCIYIVAVYGNSSTTSESQYQVSVQIPDIHHKLREGVLEKHHLERLQNSYYIFSLPDNREIQSVTFHFNVIAGDCDLAVSRSVEFPLINDTEQYSLNIDASYIFTQNDNINVNGKQYTVKGPYYIGILTIYTYCQYILTSTVVRGNSIHSQKINTIIKLVEGIPVKYSLSGYNQSAQFSINLQVNKQFKGGLHIKLAPITGQFQVCITNNKKNSSIWHFQTPRQILLIDSNHPQFKRDSTYYVMVNLLNSTTHKDQVYSFSISYHTLDFMPQLISGYPASGQINKTSYQYYKVLVFQEDKIISITKSTSSTQDHVDLYISLDQSKHYPTKDRYNLSSLDMPGGVIALNTDILQSACSEVFKQMNNIYNYRHCIIYLGVYNKYKHTIQYTLNLHKKESLIKLYDGIPLEVEYPAQNEEIHFINHVWHIKSTTIMITSHNGSIALYVSIANINKKNRNQIVFPNKTNGLSQYKSENEFINSYQSVIVPVEDLKYCKQNCSLVITVTRLPRPDYINRILSEQHLIANSLSDVVLGTFTIEITSYLHKIQIGKPTWGYQQKDSIKYYYFEVDRDICNILVTLTPIGSGEVDIVISKGSKSRPTHQVYEWGSFQVQGDEIQITKDQFKEGESMQDTYIIGVISETKSKYSLLVIYEDKQINSIFVNFPFEVRLKSWDYVYYQYYHFQNNDILINLHSEVGRSQLSVNIYNKSLEFSQQLPTARNSMWNSTKHFGQGNQLLIRTTDIHYCINCFYLISVNSTDLPLKSKVILRLQGIPFQIDSGSNVDDTITKGNYSHYIYSVYEPKSIIFNIHIYYGQPEFYISSNSLFNSADPKKAQYTINSTSSYHKRQLNLWKYIIPAQNVYEDIYCNGKSCQQQNNQESNSENTTSTDSRYAVYHINAFSPEGDTSYSIEIINGDSIILLRDGKVQLSTLQPYETQIFKFRSQSHIEKGQKIILSLNQLSKLNIKIPQINIKFQPKQHLKNSEKNVKFQEPFIVKEITDSHQGKQHIELDSEIGQYLVNVTNPNNQEIQFSIVMNSHEVIHLPLNLSHYSSIYEGQTQYYEFIAPDTGKLNAKFTQCFGTIVIHSSNSYQNLTKIHTKTKLHHKYTNDVNTNTFEGYAQGQLTMDVLKGQSVYYSVQLLSGILMQQKQFMKVINEAYYSIQSTLSTSGDVTSQGIQRFLAGNNGLITWKQQENNKFIFELYPIIQLEQQEISQYKIKYYFYIAKNPLYLDVVSRCGDIWSTQNIKIGEEGNNEINTYSKIQEYIPVNQQNIIQFEYDPENSQENVKYYSTVITKIENTLNGDIHIVNYEIAQFAVSPTTSNVKYIVGLSILGCCLLIIIIQLYNKIIQAKTQLNYEMQDIRNVARINKEDFAKPETPIIIQDNKNQYSDI